MASTTNRSALMHLDCEDGSAAMQQPMGKRNLSWRQKIATLCCIAFALGAVIGIVSFVASEPRMAKKAVVNDGEINFDMGCVRYRLSEQDDYANGIASCEVTWSPTMGKWIWSPFAHGDDLGKSFVLPVRPAVSNGRTGEPVMKTALTKPQKVNLRNREYNKMYRSEMKTRIKRVRERADGGDYAAAQMALNEAFSIIDKNVKRGVVHKNTAARRKSVIARMVKKLENGQALGADELNQLVEGDDEAKAETEVPSPVSPADPTQGLGVAMASAFVLSAPRAAPMKPAIARRPTPVMISHGKRFRKLNKPADQRKALLRGLTTELIRHGRIRSTLARCKEVRKPADHMITLAKRGTLHARRQALGYLYDKQLVHALFASAGDRYADRQGGYSRVLKDGFRRGDNSEMGIIELV